jgi:hypothetical protein
MFCLNLPAFWVNRDSTIEHSEMGTLTPEQFERLPLVDRMEIELRYE